MDKVQIQGLLDAGSYAAVLRDCMTVTDMNEIIVLVGYEEMLTLEIFCMFN